MKNYFTLLLIFIIVCNSQAQTIDFTIHFEKQLTPYYIQIQLENQKEKQKIEVDRGEDITFQLPDSLEYFTLWVEETSLRLPLFGNNIQASMHLMYPVASLTTTDKMINNWLSIVRIKKEIQDQLRTSSLTADTSQYVSLFNKHWAYYSEVLDQCKLQHSSMENVCDAEKKWLERQKADQWKKQKYRMGVHYRRLSFRQRMRDVVGTEAINIKAIAPKGDSVQLLDFKGQPIVIDFWATWCGPCKQEKPYWKNMEQKYGDQIHFISVGVKSPRDKWVSQLETKAIDNEWFIDKKQEDQLDPWNVYFIPRYVLIDEDFKVVNTELEGPSKRAFELQIQKVLE